MAGVLAIGMVAPAAAAGWKVVGGVCMSPKGPVGPKTAITNPHCFGPSQPAYVLGLGNAQAKVKVKAVPLPRPDPRKAGAK
jgi:hypothetical protein